MRCEQDRSGGWTPVALSSQAVCHGAISAWRKESLFLSTTKGLYGPMVAPVGKPGLWWSSQGPVRRGGNEDEGQGSRSWGKAAKGPGQEGREGVLLLGMCRRHKALTCSR